VTLPVVRLDGEPFEQGRQHGLALGGQIAHNLEVYYDRFLREAQLEPSEVRSRASRFVPLLEGQPYYEAIRGVAEGSENELIDVVVLNMRYELLYYQYSVLPVGGADGCTSFAVLPDATVDGHLLISENWDWIPEVEGAVLHTIETEDRFETLSFTEAGIIGGKIGLNSAGLGLCINGLLTTSDDWSRQVMPFHVRCWEILRQRTLSAAAAVVTGSGRACSANFLLAQPPTRAIDIEAAPDSELIVAAKYGTLAHTNHFVDPARLGIQAPHSERRPHSYTRLARIRELLDARRPVSIGDLQTSLRDHDNYPDSVCRHEHPDDPPEEACITRTSVIMDLDARTLWLTDGPPCEHLYERYGLTEC
jgi:isopenicillin-N N-acyltransferase like protein